MPIHISTPTWGRPYLHPLLPESPSTSAFPDARELQSSGCFSSLLFYDDQSPDFCIRLSNYFLGADAGWYERSSGDRLMVLQFVLHDTLTYRMEGGERKFMSEGQFNLFAAPSISRINWFDPANSHVDTLDIHFSPAALQKLGDDFPELMRWMGKKDVATTLSPTPATVTPIMLRMLHAIIDCPYKDGLRRSYLQSKTAVLLLLALEQLISRPAEPQAGIPLRKYDLEKLYEQYKDKLVIVGFPANNFHQQEPGTNAEISEFCKKNYGVTFPMAEKVDVIGENTHPLFKYLTEEAKKMGVADPVIGWNFTKFLIDEKGKLIAVFPSKVKPMDEQITKYLN